MTRNAISTIKGYFYQFDLSILELLKLKKLSYTVTIEGAEDVDLNDGTTTAIQCKYYEGTEYNHSVIAKPVRLMLKDYAERIAKGEKLINYKLYGYYKSGHNKLPDPITVDFLKEKLFTYTKKGKSKKHHNDLGLSQKEIEDFEKLLVIDINAEDFDNQVKSIIKLLKTEFNSSDFEAEHLHYSNALSKVKQLSTEKRVSNRTISKRKFLKTINKTDVLYKDWFKTIREDSKHLSALRKEYFTSLNTNPYERFFLIEKARTDSIVELIEIIKLISKKFSKLTQRTTNPFCPYIYIHTINKTDFLKLKERLFEEGFNFFDGYPFKDSPFKVSQIKKTANFHNEVNLKLLNSISDLNKTLATISKTREIYQFYSRLPFYLKEFTGVKHIKIQKDKVSTIKHII